MIAKAVGFDFDHTLGVDHGLELHALAILAERLGTPIDIHTSKQRAAIDAVLLPFRRAEMTMEEMIVLFTGTLSPRTNLGEASPADLAELYRENCYELVDELVEPLPGARECIKALSDAHFAIGILTNGWSPLQERKIARALGTFPGPILVSDAIGAYKPSADAFRKLGEALRCDEASLWYVGDNPAVDIGGAKTCGLHAIWLDLDGTAYPVDVPPPDARATKLTDIPRIVAGG